MSDVCAVARAGHRVADSGPASILQEQGVLPAGCPLSRQKAVCYALYLYSYCGLQPSHYLGHLLGHEGRGSLLAELKRRGWANTIVAGEQDGARGFSTFHMAVDLTEAGLANAERVVELAFRYLAMLREAGPRPEVHDELRDLSALRFRFKDKENPVSYATHLASALHVRSTLTFSYVPAPARALCECEYSYSSLAPLFVVLSSQRGALRRLPPRAVRSHSDRNSTRLPHP